MEKGISGTKYPIYGVQTNWLWGKMEFWDDTLPSVRYFSLPWWKKKATEVSLPLLWLTYWVTKGEALWGYWQQVRTCRIWHMGQFPLARVRLLPPCPLDCVVEHFWSEAYPSPHLEQRAVCAPHSTFFRRIRLESTGVIFQKCRSAHDLDSSEIKTIFGVCY